jgi:hypothetical protein
MFLIRYKDGYFVEILGIKFDNILFYLDKDYVENLIPPPRE